jgi:hypothetical protein
MSKHNIEIVGARFQFIVNNERIEIWYNETSKTILIFHGVTVYTSQKQTLSSKDAETIVWQYLESINVVKKKAVEESPAVLRSTRSRNVAAKINKRHW